MDVEHLTVLIMLHLFHYGTIYIPCAKVNYKSLLSEEFIILTKMIIFKRIIRYDIVFGFPPDDDLHDFQLKCVVSNLELFIQ